MKVITIYQPNGRIFGVMSLSLPEAMIDEIVAGSLRGTDHRALDTTAAPPDANDDYIDLFSPCPTVRPRPRLASFSKTTILTDGVDTARLALPGDPCVVTIDGEAHKVTGGVLELSAAYPGSYTVHIDYFPYRLFEETVTCA